MIQGSSKAPMYGRRQWLIVSQTYGVYRKRGRGGDRAHEKRRWRREWNLGTSASGASRDR